MKKWSRLTALMLAFVIMFSTVSGALAAVEVDYEALMQWIQSVKEANGLGDVIWLDRGGKVIFESDSFVPSDWPLYTEEIGKELAFAEGEQEIALKSYGKVELIAPSAGQWQVYAANTWVDVKGETGSSFDVTFAKVKTLFEQNGYAKIRCVAGDSVTETAMIALDYSDNVIAMPAMAEDSGMAYSVSKAADNGIATIDDDNTYTIRIDYKMYNSQTAADPWIATVAKKNDESSTLQQTFSAPTVQGYAPALAATYEGVTLSKNAAGEYIITLDLTITQSMAFNIVYQPALVNYTVKHYWQNVDNDNYTLHETETLSALTNSTVEEVAKVYVQNGTTVFVEDEYKGFYSLLYDHPIVAADGSTEVEVYYDRNYYLMLFDLDGGHGVEPVYARYGAAIDTQMRPGKAGYSFAGWTLDGKTATLPATMPYVAPNETLTFKATWAESTSSYMVEYYLQDPNDGTKYNFFASRTIPADTGATINPETYKEYKDITNIPLDEYEKKYSEYKEAVATDATVAGDGSSVVRVYYDRKEFRLKFYYAMSSNGTYYVIGGSTYYFGVHQDSTATNKADEKALLNQYFAASSYSEIGKQVGQVTSLPTLKDGVQYTIGTDTATVNTKEYTYYYLTFTAKYGANLEALWPSDVFNPVTTSKTYNGSNTAYASAWNGEHHVYYTQNNANQTIKGKYGKLDYQLLWDEGKGYVLPEGDNTVSYLCFWENGANIGWSVPELYRYYIYVQPSPGMDLTGETIEMYDNKQYYLRDDYATVDDSDWANQTAPALEGLEYVGTDYKRLWNDDTEDYYSSQGYTDAYEMYFYYKPMQYDLKFVSEGQEVKSEKLYYEESFANNHYFEPAYPSHVWPEGAVEFEGWYTSPSFTADTKVNFTTQIMPPYAMVLYANWVPKDYTVTFYKDEPLTDNNKLYGPYTVAYGTKLEPIPADPTNGDYIFVGWFYKENGEEKAFDFKNMAVTKNLQVYAKWSSNVLKAYTVYFRLNSEDGIDIADPITGSMAAGLSRTFYAKGGDDLYEGYREGYFPHTDSHTLKIEMEGDNTFVFIYTAKAAVPYTVKYLKIDQDGNVIGKAFPDKEVRDNKKAIVTEQFKPLSGWMPDKYQKELVVVEGGTNEIIFYYTEDDKHALVLKTHYLEPIVSSNDYSTWIVYPNAGGQITGEVGQTYSEAAVTIPGFVFDATISNTSGTLTNTGLHLQLYYRRLSYPYKVQYLEENTNKKLADETLTDANGKQLTGKYEQVVSANAIDIENYELVSAATLTTTIKIEDPANVAAKNVITFYYKEKEAAINYVPVFGDDNHVMSETEQQTIGTVNNPTESVPVKYGTASGSTAVLKGAPTYKFVGWYSDPECKPEDLVSTELTYVPEQPGRTVDDDGKTVYGLWPEETTFYAKFDYNLTTLTIKKSCPQDIDAGQSFLFKVEGYGLPEGGLLIAINGNGSETISGLTVGQSYTVTEVENWSWRYTAEPKSITLTSTPSENKVEMVNTRDQIYWLSGDCYEENVFGEPSGN